MTVRWRNGRTGPFLVVAWLVGSVAISFILTSSVAGQGFAVYVLGAWAAVFVAFTYFVIALAVNSTTVCVESGKLVVTNGPLPGGGNSATDVRDITDVLTTSYMTPGAKGPGGVAYRVLARTRASGTIPIFSLTMIGDLKTAEDLARKVEAMIWKSGVESA
jgi:hypothetical protein